MGFARLAILPIVVDRQVGNWFTTHNGERDSISAADGGAAQPVTATKLLSHLGLGRVRFEQTEGDWQTRCLHIIFNHD